MDVVKARFGFLFIALLSLTACAPTNSTSTSVFPTTAAKCTPNAVANQYVVRWKDGTTAVYKNATRDEIMKTVIEPNLEKIEFAEQDQKITMPQTPKQVSTEASVPQSPTWGQQITQAEQAWSQGYTGTGIVVAVVDSGVDRTHDQLKNQIFVNTGEVGLDRNGADKSNNGFDDDLNGYIDDVSGYDFQNNSPNVVPVGGHGTHVAGIIGAQHSAGSVLGVAEGVKILPLNFMYLDPKSGEGTGDISNAIRAMYYAAKMGAKVINASWGGAPCSKNLQKAIADVGAQGVLFVVAAGNDGVNLDNDSQFSYPAAFGMSTQVTVGSSNQRDYANFFSNYSSTLVHLMAPGDSIVSTFPDTSPAHTTNMTATLSGTSMATPFVAGTAAILMGARPNASLSDVKNALLNSVDAGPFQVSSHGRLNVKNALAEILKLPQ